MKKWGLIILKVVVTVSLLTWLFGRMDLSTAIRHLSQANPFYLLAVLLITWFGHFLCVIRWKNLLAGLDIFLRTLPLVLIYGAGMFFNLVFPGLVGGDLVKAYLTGRDTGGRYSMAFVSIFLDRNVGFVAMILIATMAALVYPTDLQGYSLQLMFLLLTLACLGINLILFNEGTHRLLSRILRAARLVKLDRKVDLVSRSFLQLRRHPDKLVLAAALSLINQFLMIVSNYWVARSLGIDAPFKYFFLFIPAIVLITMIPISINGVGLREFAFMSFFSSIGVSQELGTLMGFLASLMIIASSLPGIAAYLLYRKDIRTEELSQVEVELLDGKGP